MLYHGAISGCGLGVGISGRQVIQSVANKLFLLYSYKLPVSCSTSTCTHSLEMVYEDQGVLCIEVLLHSEARLCPKVSFIELSILRSLYSRLQDAFVYIPRYTTTRKITYK